MKNSNISLKDFVKEIDFPYIVHGCVPDEDGNVFPTHSHGMELIDEPEYLINLRCFGNEGNTRAINTVHAYLNSNPEIKAEILDGKIAELQISDELVLCMRAVEKDFAAVRIAYEELDLEDMEFIQIYVKGDDFALTDGYYLNNENLEVESLGECFTEEMERR